MQRRKLAALATATLTGAALLLPLSAGQVSAAPSPRGDAKAPGAAAPHRTGSDQSSDNLSMPWQKGYEQRQQLGLEQKLRSGSRSSVQKVAPDKFARTGQTGGDRIFVVLAEFGDTRHSAYCDDVDTDEDPSNDPCTFPSDGTPQRYDGPGFNEIPEPDRTEDNSTLWDPAYDSDYYRNMYFNRMRNFYE